MNSRTVAECRRSHCRGCAALLNRQHGVAPTNQSIVVENEATGVARLCTKVLKVEVKSLHDAGWDKNCRTTCLPLRLGRSSGRSGEEHAGAVTLARGAGRCEKHGAHASSRGRRRLVLLLRLLKRRPCRRVQTKSSIGVAAAADVLGTTAQAHTQLPPQNQTTSLTTTYNAMAGSSSMAALACFLVAAAAVVAATPQPPKETHLRVYWHDQASGNATVVTVAKAASTNTSKTRFSAVQVMDDALTLGPNLTTSDDIVGRAQGIYVSDGIESSTVMMAMNFVFIKGPYANSSIAIFGPNYFLTAVREMSIIGGTGMFRFARGYVQARTYWLDNSTGDAIVKYDIFVRHDH